MLQPRRVKWRKHHRGHRRGLANAGNTIAFGEYGLQALDAAWIDGRQIEAARRAITHHVKRGGKVWIRMFPDKPVSKKPLEVRMGGGKGNVEYWTAVIQPGKVLYEIEGVPEDAAREAFKLAAAKLPVRTTFIRRTLL